MGDLLARQLRRKTTGIRLQDAVIVALVILLVVSIGIASFIWYWNSRQAVGDVIQMIQSETGSQIEEHLRHFLAVPHEINETNAAAISLIGLNLLGSEGLETLFLGQIRIFETISSIYAGSPEGGLIDAGREGTGSLYYVIDTEEFRSGPFKKYRVDDEGNRVELLLAVPDFDARTRPWFKAAVEKQSATWSDIYVLFSGQDMAVAASRPVYDGQGNLLMVLSSDIFLSQIDDFMRSLEYGKTGLGFIIERSGAIVACSDDQLHLRMDEVTHVADRMQATESSSPVIQHTALFLEETFDELSAINASYQGGYSLDGEQMLVQVTPIRDAYGIDWLSVIVIPEADFLDPLIASAKAAILLLAIALAVAISIGFVFVRWITRPLKELTLAARTMGEGKFVRIPHSKRIREIQDLSYSFEEMGVNLSSSLVSLQQEIDEREQAQRTLQESEERLRMYIEKAPIAIFVANAAGQHIDVNPAARLMTGYSEAELLRMGMLELIGGDEAEADLSLFHRLKETGFSSGEAVVHKKDGSELWIQIDSVALAPDRLVAFCTDITQRKQTEESLRHKQKMESLGTMASGVAHEINNPLMGMMSYAELIGSRITDPQAKNYAKNILREGERIAHITRNLLSFSQDNGAARHPADVCEIIADSLPLVQNAMLHSQITVETELDQSVPEIICSRQQIQQVIVNLLMNAREALDVKYPSYDMQKTIRIRVEPSTRDGETWVRTSIEDHGAGMSTNAAALAFDPFFTTKSRDKAPGLGLTISFSIIQQHGGEITIQSEEDKGTIVQFDLPAAPSDSAS